MKSPPGPGAAPETGGLPAQIDQALVQSIDQYGFDRNTTMDCLVKNEKNSMTATYYLLKKQKDNDPAQGHRRNQSVN